MFFAECGMSQILLLLRNVELQKMSMRISLLLSDSMILVRYSNRATQVGYSSL